jgi:hypothetical protein
MNAIFGLLNIIPGAVWFAMCVGLFGWGGVNQYRINSAQAQIATIRADQATAVSEAQRRASAMTRNLQETKDAAIAKAEKRAEENRVAAAGARTELDRLRKQSASGASNAGTSLQACTDYAASANTVLNECAGALVSLAEVADGHVNDLRTYTESWPAWDKFTNEMTDFKSRLLAFTKGQ